MKDSLKIAVAGATGYVGLELIIGCLRPTDSSHWRDVVNLCLTSPAMAKKFLFYYVQVCQSTNKI